MATGNKLLAVIVNFGEEQLEYLQQVVSELKSFIKYDVTVVINSNIPLTIKGADCVNVISLRDYQLLPLTCRQLIKKQAENYDYFIYTENDHLWEEHHVDKYIEYEKILPANRIAGLIQYETSGSRLYYPAYHAHFEWDFKCCEIYGGKVFSHFSNVHQASFVISQKKLLEIMSRHDIGRFFGQNGYSEKCRVNTQIYENAGMKKLICVSEFDQNLIHHLPNIYINGDRGRLKLGSWEERMNESIAKILDIARDPIGQYYNIECQTKSDINEHMPTLLELANECETVTELGTRWVTSTWAFLKSSARRITMIDEREPDFWYNRNDNPSRTPCRLEKVRAAAPDKEIRFIKSKSVDAVIADTDMLFVDTWHCYDELKSGLDRNAAAVKKYIVLHDVELFKTKMQKAIDEFLEENRNWSVYKWYVNNNGLGVLARN